MEDTIALNRRAFADATFADKFKLLRGLAALFCDVVDLERLRDNGMAVDAGRQSELMALHQQAFWTGTQIRSQRLVLTTGQQAALVSFVKTGTKAQHCFVALARQTDVLEDELIDLLVDVVEDAYHDVLVTEVLLCGHADGAVAAVRLQKVLLEREPLLPVCRAFVFVADSAVFVQGDAAGAEQSAVVFGIAASPALDPSPSANSVLVSHGKIDIDTAKGLSSNDAHVLAPFLKLSIPGAAD